MGQFEFISQVRNFLIRLFTMKCFGILRRASMLSSIIESMATS